MNARSPTTAAAETVPEEAQTLISSIQHQVQVCPGTFARMMA